MPSSAATELGVNLLDGAAAARPRKVCHALREIFGYVVDVAMLALLKSLPSLKSTQLENTPSLWLIVDGALSGWPIEVEQRRAVFRAAAALGVDAVLVTPRCADPLYRRSVRVSMGTVFQVPWTRIQEWPAGLEELRAAGFTVVALALADDAVSLDELAADLPERLALVLGTEGDGLSAHAVAAADVVVRIPMAGGVDSLNVAAASAVAFWATRV